jgi:DNA-binding GntR family transcriptional regulator
VDSMSKLAQLPRPSGRVAMVAAPLRKQVIGLLRASITGAEYRPGERLVEGELCRRFEVSRTVIREALRHLEAEGLVEVVPNRGPVVARITRDEARALYEVREALESLAAARFTIRATMTQKRALGRSLARIQTAYAKGELVGALVAKTEFYRALCEGAANPVITSMLSAIQARVQLLRGLSLSTPGRADASLEELRRVVEAIDRNDPVGAGRLAAEHVRNASVAAMQRLADSERGESERVS